MGNEHFKDILKMQQSLYDACVDNNRTEKADENVEKQSLKSVFELINGNFQQFYSPENQADLLPILHHALEWELKAVTNTDIDKYLCDLVEQHRGNEPDLKIVLQIIYQILQSLRTLSPNENGEEGGPTKRIVLSDAVFNKLIDLMLVGDLSRIVNTNVMTCLELYIHQGVESKLIEQLWNNISRSSQDQLCNSQLCVQVLVHLFDEFVVHVPDFHRSPQLVKIVQHLLLSGERGQRKSAYFLMKKILEVLILKVSSNVSEWELDVIGELRQRWATYITIMENLEENQSHLILPSLAAYNNCDYSSTSWKVWSNILYKRILRHNNILVIRWALEYILKTFSCAQLNPDVLLEFLEATNNTCLYNLEGYFLPKEHIGHFLNCELRPFFECLAQINWKAVPLHFWLQQMPSNVDVTSFRDMLLPLAARVRALQNPVIRLNTIRTVEKIFAVSINEMTLSDYMVLVETLYNVMDDFNANLELYLQKVKRFSNVSESLCSLHVYKLIAKKFTVPIDPLLISVLADIPKERSVLADTPKERHGCLRFLIVFDSAHSSDIITFCRSKYDIDINAMKEATLPEITRELSDKLVHHKDEEFLVRERAVDFFVRYRVARFSDLEQQNISIEELMDTGSFRTLLRCSELLADETTHLEPQVWKLFVHTLQNALKHEAGPNLILKVVEPLLKHCKKTTPMNVAQNCAEELLNIDLENIELCTTVLWSEILLSEETYVRGLVIGDPKTGDARIEEHYQSHLKKTSTNFMLIRYEYLDFLSEKNILNTVYNKLFELNAEISRKKPRYFENSKEHRLKIRIVFALLRSMQMDKHANLWRNDLWNVLLEQNNQLNITYTFELMIAKYAPNLENVLDKLEQVAQYTASQQVSIICVAHNYCVLRRSSLTPDQVDCIIEALLPSTMGANFQSRLYSQLAILSLLQKFKNNSSKMRHMESAIKDVIGEKASVLLKQDIRLTWVELFESLVYHYEYIFMYITNVPYDEYWVSSQYSKYDDARALFAKKICNYAKPSPEEPAQVVVKKADTSNVQRKLNPISDVLLQSDLTSYPKCQENELYVIASLIDKLPNLGGIARTCEVLGIKNLILENKAHVEKSDFKTLSMTAENGLNIIEVKSSALIDYLVRKQMEGFKIVGAEQTAESVCFADFKFPKKCILLLGHEKEGIPANLLGFLDYAVEIPQFGMVRSLNVHVTGALFMWEYCKQHTIGK